MGALWILDYGHPQHGGDPPRSPDDVAAFARLRGSRAQPISKAATCATRSGTNRTRSASGRRIRMPGSMPRCCGKRRRRFTGRTRRRGWRAAGWREWICHFWKRRSRRAGRAEVNAVGRASVSQIGSGEPGGGTAAAAPTAGRAAVGEKAEIWDTEWGYASYDYFSQNLRGDGHSAPGRKRQAVLACREALTVWALGLPVAVWYDLRDDGDDPKNPEHNYGLLDAKNADKPAMQAHPRADTHRRAITPMRGWSATCRMGRMRCAWTAARTRSSRCGASSRIPASPCDFRRTGFVSATNLMGEAQKVKDAGRGEAAIAIVETEGPVYLRFTPR